MHRLKGKCVFEKIGDKEVCKVCDLEKDAPLDLNIFSSGDAIMADKINHNFSALAEVTRTHSIALQSLEKSMNDRLKLMEKSLREVKKNV